jgi:hypothetical protein
LDKLVKQLRRDMAANPKKAAALGLMVLVALYFWGPLIVQWVSSGSNKRSKMDTAALILTDDPIEPAQQNRTRSASRFRWERARQLILQDSLMSSAVFDPIWVDPFAKSAAAIALEQSAETGSEAAPASEGAATSISPDELSLVLGGVFLGPKNRVATINGEACREGDTITVPGKDDKSLSQKIRIVQIRRQSVMIEVGGKLLAIELTTPSLAHGDEIQRQKPPTD